MEHWCHKPPKGSIGTTSPQKGALVPQAPKKEHWYHKLVLVQAREQGITVLVQARERG